VTARAAPTSFFTPRRRIICPIVVPMFVRPLVSHPLVFRTPEALVLRETGGYIRADRRGTQPSCHSIWWYSEHPLIGDLLLHCNRRTQACTYLTRSEPPFDLRSGRALPRGVDSRYQSRLPADFCPAVFGQRHNPGFRRRQIFRSPLTCKPLEFGGSVQA
jgi:hypothetical protein